jgi:hypothetical protein
VIVASAEGDVPELAFGQGVVTAEAAVVEEPRQRDPVVA